MDEANNPIRGLIAVLGGLLVLFVLSQVMELVLVRTAAQQPLKDLGEYMAVRNRTGVLAGLVASQVVAALLAGYMSAKLAGSAELLHAGIAAALQTVLFAWGFTSSETAPLTPVWMRWAIILVTAPAMLVGAMVRAKARALQETT
jgi:hypothetical protein